MHADKVVHPNIIPLCVWLASGSIFISTEALEYKELENLGISCFPMDSCRNRTGEYLYYEHSCSCLSRCVSQENCCIDSPYAGVTSTSNATCTRIHGSRYAFLVVTHCDSRWTGPKDIVDLCEGTNLLLGNPVEVVPVTSPFSGVTYKNYFCAKCNNDCNDIVFWDVEVSSKSYFPGGELLQDGATPHVVQYEGDRWVIRLPSLPVTTEGNLVLHRDTRSPDDVQQVNLHISLPVDLAAVIVWCRLELVRQCNPNWDDAEVKRKCESYAATVIVTGTDKDNFFRRRLFRNVHCAICNGVTDFSNASCIPYEKPIFVPTRVPTHPATTIPSMTAWFGHLLWDRRCLREEDVYVERLKGCRTIFCSNPRHVIRNRRCVLP